MNWPHEEILQSLTEKKVKEEIEKINLVKIPKDLQNWVEEYYRFGHREDFIWKWIYKVSQVVTLKEVGESMQSDLWRVKFLLIMFVVLLDDIADQDKDREFLQHLINVPFEKSQLDKTIDDKHKSDYLNFTTELWQEIEKIYMSFFKSDIYAPIIEFDIKQVLNAMEYSYLINSKPYLINSSEYKLYLPHNMQYVVDIMFDLSSYEDFNLQEFGVMREIATNGQMMTRIGNWLSTWERELGEGDFSSIVFAYGLEQGVLKLECLQGKNEQIVDLISQTSIENNILKEWSMCYQKIEQLSKNVKSIDVGSLLDSLRTIFTMHMSSKGYK